MGLDKCRMTRIHHYCIMYSIFSALRNLSPLPVYPKPHPDPTLLLFMCEILSMAFGFLVFQFSHQQSKDNNNTYPKGLLQILGVRSHSELSPVSAYQLDNIIQL